MCLNFLKTYAIIASLLYCDTNALLYFLTCHELTNVFIL